MRIIYIFVLFLSYSLVFSNDITITSHPSSKVECVGKAISLSVSAFSESNQQLNFQWYKDNQKINEANTPVIYIENLQHINSGIYHCEVSNSELTIKSNAATVYALRPTNITKEPQDILTTLNNETVSFEFEAHINGLEIFEAENNKEFVKIQWFLFDNLTSHKLENNEIYDGVSSSKLSINTKNIPDTTYYFAELEGKCGTVTTKTVRLIKNLILLDISINGIYTCLGNFETIKSQIENPENHKLTFRWFKDGKAFYHKENVQGVFSDELKFNPIEMNDAGKYKLEARIDSINYAVFSNEVDVEICTKPEVIAIRIDSMTGTFLGYKRISLRVFLKKSCNSVMNVYENDSLFDSIKLDDYKMSYYDIPNPAYSMGALSKFFVRDRDIDEKYSIAIYNDCGMSQSDTVTVRDNLNDFEGRDPLNQYREFCEDDTTSLRFYFTYMKPNNNKIDYLWRSDIRFDCNPEFYSGCRTNVLHFKSLRKIDNGLFYLRASISGDPNEQDYSVSSPAGFVFKVKPKPDIKRQPISKNVANEDRDTLIYILFDNEPQLPISVELYYMASLSGTPRLIDKTEAEYGMWYRYIKDIGFSDAGYYFAKVNHYNECAPRFSDTVKISVISKGATSISNPDSERSIIVHPNPASDFITIQLSNTGLQPFATTDKVQIFDVLGIEIKDLTPTPLQIGEGLRIDVSHLPAGVYFIRIGNKVEKFVKM
ncbi:MAG: immunoglobulin domain-containing protein [Candidatus Kapabacteria bacterium]|nr:immunoglobulin domain-containing protein [Ignavibacteriota bacterium]MCW5883936.1 immunoglobulin domain-containing protein [Candidatus Kapabacteria bacterium]